MIAILDYNMGNLRSVQKALEYIGYQAVITSDPREISAQKGLILPGVGAFDSAMRHLKNNGLDLLIKDWSQSNKPLLGICLGHQLLFNSSEEGGQAEGLGIMEGYVKRFDAKKGKVPNMGWSVLNHNGDWIFNGTANGTPMYFVHSYYVDCPDRYIVAASEHCGVRFCAAAKRGNTYGVQFHPEKSGDEGLKILSNFAKISEGLL